MNMSKEKIVKLASIVIGLLITIVLIWFGLRFVQRGKAIDLNPQDIKIENVTGTSFRVTYTTRANLQPVVNYGTSSTALNFLVPPSETNDLGNDQTKYMHDITLLTPGTYYFVIRIGEEEINNAGVPFSVQVGEGAGVTPTFGVGLLPTQAIEATPTATLPTAAPAIKPLSEIKNCATDMKSADGTIKDGYTARDYAQCINQNSQ